MYRDSHTYPNVKDDDIGSLRCRFLHHTRSLGSTRALPAVATTATAVTITIPRTAAAAGWTTRRERGGSRDAREPPPRRRAGSGAAEREPRERDEEDVARHGEAARRGGRGGVGRAGGEGGAAAERGEEAAAAEEEGLGAGGDEGLGEREDGRGHVHHRRGEGRSRPGLARPS